MQAKIEEHNYATQDLRKMSILCEPLSKEYALFIKIQKSPVVIPVNNFTIMKICQTTEDLPRVGWDLWISKMILLIDFYKRTLRYKFEEDI